VVRQAQHRQTQPDGLTIGNIKILTKKFMKKTKLMTHIVAGYPNMKKCEEIAILMASQNVDFIEIQIPFSDPVADGKTIMDANTKALKNGVNTDDCFALMEMVRCSTSSAGGQQDKPELLFMTYYNVVYRYGIEAFCEKARKAGAYGLIVPDIPLDEEEYDHFIEIANKYELNVIQIISPNTTIERLKKIAKVAKGFVYCVSRHGTTGEKANLNKNLGEYLARVRKYIKIPIALGFGISTKKQIIEASKIADIVVVGSKIINIYNESENEKKLEKIKEFLKL